MIWIVSLTEKWVKSTSLSRSKSISSSFRSIVVNNPNRLLHRKWAESSSLSLLDKWSRVIWRISLRQLSVIHFSVSQGVFLFSKSILDDDPKTPYRSKVNEIHFCFCLWISLFLSLDLSSTMNETMGESGIQKYKKVSRSPENHEEVQKSAFPSLIGTLTPIKGEWISFLFHQMKFFLF